MRILLIALLDTLENKVQPLEEAGHTVKLITGRGDLVEDGEPVYYSLFEGDDIAVAHALREIDAFSPDLVINAISWLVLPPSDDYTYCGNTAASARLETYRWETRAKAQELGWSLPTVIHECKMNEVPEYNKTVYVKEKYDSQAKQIFKHINNDAGNSSELFNKDMTTNGLTGDAYIEDAVDYAVEAWCYFTICNGSYSIIRSIAATGYGDDKLLGGLCDWRLPKIEIHDLTDSQSAAWHEKCNAWLTYAATLGGNYEGIIGGCITEDNEVFWFEHGGRPETYNSGALPGTIQDWIDSLTVDSTKAIHHISAAEIRESFGYG